MSAPPHSLDAERSVLGAALLDTAVADYVTSRLTPAAFYRRAHQVIFDAMRALRDTGRPVDLLTLVAELGPADVGGPAYLTGLIDGLPHGSNVAHYADILEDCRTKRDLGSYARKLIEAIAGGDKSSHVLLVEADRDLLALQGGRAGRLAPLSMTALFRDLEDRVAHKGELRGLPTGFDSLNQLTGGWQRGDLIVLAARPSIGKTTLVVNQTVAAARAGATVAFYSLEMKRQQLAYRILSSLSGVPLTHLLNGLIASGDYVLLTDALNVIDTLPIWIDDLTSRTAWDIRASCRQLRAERGLDLVVIDYVQLMAGTLARRNATRNEEMTDISRRLKMLAGELDVPVILLSQLTRASEARADPRPKLTDLRESGALEQDADLVILLHRKNHKASGATQCIIEKARNGPTGTLMLTLESEVTRFVDGGEEPAPEPAPTPAKSRLPFGKRYR